MINPSELNLYSLPWVPLNATAGFPSTPGIYFAIDSQANIQYIGRSGNVRGRWKNHHRYKELEEIGGVKIAYLFIDDLLLLDSVEQALIAWFDPPLNVMGKKSGTITRSNVEIRLKQVRESRNLSQFELAQRAGMSPQNIQKLEQGRSKGVQLDTLDLLCDALSCEIQDLLVRVKIDCKEGQP